MFCFTSAATIGQLIEGAQKEIRERKSKEKEESG
jgi:hypothetical protein